MVDTRDGQLSVTSAGLVVTRLPVRRKRLSEQNGFNARLIAAAPDLLEALEEIAEYLEGCADADVEGPNREMRLFMTARAAIAKATGGSDV